jgi:triosephosphate isomerase (TIM)
MPERRPCVAANWKMHKTGPETAAYFEQLLPRLADLGGTAGAVDVVVCPPYTSLGTAARCAEGSAVRVAAQNMHEEEDGPYTGEVSAPMLRDAGAAGVILGHSERRQLFGETDEALARKLPVALGAGLEPILCVGETEEERDSGRTEAVLERQLVADLAEIGAEEIERVVIAYEPIWAIGTGRTATPEQAEEAIGFVRELVRARAEGAAERVRILYGGSVKPGNAAELLQPPGVDGALVGGASLDPADFAAIVAAAA